MWLYRQLMTYPGRSRIGSDTPGPSHGSRERAVDQICAGGGGAEPSALARRTTGHLSAVAYLSEPHIIVRSSRRRAE